MPRYRIIQEYENEFFIQRKTGFFWWSLTAGLIPLFPSMDAALERVKEEKKRDQELFERRNFRKRAFEVMG